MSPALAQATTVVPVDDSGALGAVEEQMGLLANRIRVAIRDTAFAVDPELTPLGLRLLRLIESGAAVHPSVAAEQLLVDRSVLSRLVRDLERLGLVEVARDEADGRSRVLSLSGLGAERLRNAGPGNVMLVRRALRSWPEDDLRRFAGYLERINRFDDDPSGRSDADV